MTAQFKGWWLAGLGLAWISGVALQLHERVLQDAAVYAAAFAGGGVCVGIALLRVHPRVKFLIGLLGVTLLGFGMTGGRAVQRVAHILPASLESRDIVVEGVVASLPQSGEAGSRFRFRVESALLEGAPRPTTTSSAPRGGSSEVAKPHSLESRAVTLPLLALGWYRGHHEDASSTQPRHELRAGQRWRFTVRVRQPHGNVNLHGFDYELYLFELGVGATGYVRNAPALLLDRAAGYPIERLRQWVRDAIEASVPQRRIAGVLAALAIGDQGAIEREDWDLFRNTGVAHLMSISGLHVTMFAWATGLLVAAWWRRSSRALLRVPLPSAMRWGGLAAAVGYALLSGWGVPAQRTVWMLAAVTGLQALGLAWPWTLVLLAAACVVSLIDPWALLQPGFWLSFGAVGLLMASRPAHAPGMAVPRSSALSGAMARFVRVLRGGLRTQVVATLGLTPLSLVFFQQVSLVGLLANLLAIPVVTLLITPLALLGVFAAPLWALAATLTSGLISALSGLAALPGAVWSLPAAPAWAQIAALSGAALLIMPVPWRARLLALPLTFPLLMPQPLPVEAGSFELDALDVGQGTAVLVRTQNHLLLYDAGPQYSRDSDAGQRVLLPMLRGRGVTRIDKLVLSHRDTDHVGGARSLLGALAVDELVSSLEDSHPLLPSTTAARTRCAAGQSWSWDGVRFDMLAPQTGDFERGLKPNALSCVLRVSAAQGSVLLTGDIEREQESALVAAHGVGLRSDVLIVPHHGSKSSSTALFLDTVSPRWAVVQAGYRNRFGHPAQEVMARYLERNIETVDSASCGAWFWHASQGMPGSCLRETSRRYWRHDALPGSAR